MGSTAVAPGYREVHRNGLIGINLIGRGENSGPNGVGASEDNTMYTLTKADVHAVVYEAHAQDARYREQDVAPTIQARHSNMTNTPLVYESHPNDSRITNMGDTCTTVTARWGTGGNNTPLVASDKPKIKATIRRLTPIECERLQGFPDDFTKIPWRNKPKEECPDGHRYKVLGNSMAVPVVEWIGKRLINVHNKLEGHNNG